MFVCSVWSCHIYQPIVFAAFTGTARVGAGVARRADGVPWGRGTLDEYIYRTKSAHKTNGKTLTF